MKGKIGAILLALVMVFGLIGAVVCLERIPAGYVGVVYNMNGGVDGEILTQGWHLVSPTKKVTTYSIGIEQSYLTAEDKGDSKDDESFSIPTSDGKTVRVNLEFSYRFDEARVANTFVTFKGKSGESEYFICRFYSVHPGVRDIGHDKMNVGILPYHRTDMVHQVPQQNALVVSVVPPIDSGTRVVPVL